MFIRSLVVLAYTALIVRPVWATSYLDLSAIKYFYTTGASVDWWGSPSPYNAPDYANTANGPNHIEYLAYQRNWQLSKWAYPGAVTDPSLVTKTVDFNWVNQIAYVKGQFNSDIQSGAYGAATGANTLFLVTASNTGNDILNSYNTAAANTSDARTNTIQQLVQKIGQGAIDLHNMGARDFIFLSVLPVHKIPKIQDQGSAVFSDVQNYVQQYQSKLQELVNNLSAYFTDSNLYLPDFTQAFYDAQDGKLSGPTAGYLARSTYCPNLFPTGEVTNLPRNPNFNDCPYGARARQFLFYDNIHFTSPLHCEYAYRTLFALVGYNAVYPGNCQYASGTN